MDDSDVQAKVGWGAKWEGQKLGFSVQGGWFPGMFPSVPAKAQAPAACPAELTSAGHGSANEADEAVRKFFCISPSPPAPARKTS